MMEIGQIDRFRVITSPGIVYVSYHEPYYCLQVPEEGGYHHVRYPDFGSFITALTAIRLKHPDAHVEPTTLVPGFHDLKEVT